MLNKQILGWMDVSGLGMGAKGRFARGARVGNLVFLSGQTAFDENDRLTGIGDPRAQTVNALANIRMLLKEAGAEMSDVVKITVYVTDVSFRPVVYEEIAKAFAGKSPSSTGLVVNGLARKELLVEIDAIAAIADSGSAKTRRERRVSQRGSRKPILR